MERHGGEIMKNAIGRQYREYIASFLKARAADRFGCNRIGDFAFGEPQFGDCWGAWKYKSNLTLSLEPNGQEIYWVDLEHMGSAAGMLDTIFQVAGKSFSSEVLGNFIEALDDLLHPQRKVLHGRLDVAEYFDTRCPMITPRERERITLMPAPGVRVFCCVLDDRDLNSEVSYREEVVVGWGVISNPHSYGDQVQLLIWDGYEYAMVVNDNISNTLYYVLAPGQELTEANKAAIKKELQEKITTHKAELAARKQIRSRTICTENRIEN
jgi:hypothetical protein